MPAPRAADAHEASNVSSRTSDFGRCACARGSEVVIKHPVIEDQELFRRLVDGGFFFELGHRVNGIDDSDKIFYQ